LPQGGVNLSGVITQTKRGDVVKKLLNAGKRERERVRERYPYRPHHANFLFAHGPSCGERLPALASVKTDGSMTVCIPIQTAGFTRDDVRGSSFVQDAVLS
jgi:hypothetical protein